MKKTLVLLLLVVIHSPSSVKAFSVHRMSGQPNIPGIDQEVQDLLATLSPKKTKDESGITLADPSLEAQEKVPKRILEIANHSREARARVIYWLVRVLEDPTALTESALIATRWVTAVRLLGKLAATEAIDLLIDNLDQTGQIALRISISFRPVVGALINIGKPAVPKLVVALSHNKPSIRREAASTLAAIGGAEAIKAIEQAALTETDEDVLGTFKAILPKKDPEKNIEVVRKASFEGCADGQVLAAAFQAIPGDNMPAAGQMACARAPVEITRMVVKADGSYFLHFRNLDNKRRVVGVSYLITALDGRGKAESESHFAGGLLAEPAEPQTEIVEKPETPNGRIKLEAGKTYLVQFSSILFAPWSEWQFKAACSSTRGLMGITCKEAKY